jgi:peptidoglycan/LPS O-acetylase OafA/YrhL
MAHEGKLKQRFVALDGLRGFCAVIVAVLHLYDFGRVEPPLFIKNSFIFVDFFFVLSGFVIAHAYAGALKDGDGTLRFFIRRFGRLYPLHAFVLLLFFVSEAGKAVAVSYGVAASVPPFSDKTTLGALAANLALVHSLGLYDHLTWNFPSWSISVEFYSNLLYGLLFAGFLQLARVPYHVKAVTLVVFGFAASLWFIADGRVMTFDAGIFRCIYGFFLGTLVEIVHRRAPIEGGSRTLFSVLEIGAVIATYIFAVSFGEGTLLASAPLPFAVFVYLFAHERGFISKLLTTPPSATVGELSYSIYLVHEFLIINGIGRIARPLATVLHPRAVAAAGSGASGEVGAMLTGGLVSTFGLIGFYVLVVIGVSMVTYRYVEVPARRYFNTIAKTTRLRPATAAPVKT